VGYNTHAQREENGENDGSSSSSLLSSSLPSLSTLSSSSTSSFLDVIHEQYQADLFQEMDHLLLQPQPTTTTTTPPLLTSIYFGGGTPSLAPVSMIEGVLQRIRQAFPTLDDDDDDDDQQQVEITMEMDPGTFDVVQLQALKDLGINRISLGVQSFDDTILEQLGRVHRKKDIEDAVQMIHQVYGGSSSSSSSSRSGENRIHFSMDLISGVPGLTEAKWVDTLQQATTGLFASASHLSIYDLQVEEGTVFGRWYTKEGGKSDATATTSTSGTRRNRSTMSLPSEDSVARMYKFTAGYLRAKGFEHYEGKCERRRNKRFG
jgi:coproporphyrinogen III oxidase-like Fe-S oxidoreductase